MEAEVLESFTFRLELGPVPAFVNAGINFPEVRPAVAVFCSLESELSDVRRDFGEAGNIDADFFDVVKVFGIAFGELKLA